MVRRQLYSKVAFGMGCFSYNSLNKMGGNVSIKTFAGISALRLDLVCRPFDPCEVGYVILVLAFVTNGGKAGLGESDDNVNFMVLLILGDTPPSCTFDRHRLRY